MLPDIQNSKSNFSIALNRVGVTNLKFPIQILQRSGHFQHTVADIDCFVDLEADIKGISMSRLPIGIQKFINKPIDGKAISIIAEHIRLKSEAKICQLIYKFPYFVQRESPVAKEPGFIHYNIIFNGTKSEENYKFKFAVEITASSLCPCSKEISNNGAHNQRSKILITLTPKENEWLWIEDIAKIGEDSSSCPIYSILKRSDEKYVTEQMYNNPAFVEDITRNCYSKLLEYQDKLEAFIIEVSNEESIHLHNAYSRIDYNC